MKTSWKVSHVGVVVKDMDSAVRHYESLGFGPFEPVKGPPIVGRVIHGKPAPEVKNVSTYGPMGGIRLDITQPVSGISIQKEFLDKHGEGVNHIGFIVDDLSKEAAKLEKMGFKPVSAGRATPYGPFTFIYFDTDRIGGFLIDLTQQSE